MIIHGCNMRTYSIYIRDTYHGSETIIFFFTLANTWLIMDACPPVLNLEVTMWRDNGHEAAC
jgi:hypothetical protein